MRYIIILLPLIILFADDLIKIDGGFMLPSKQAKTFYTGKILWGKHYSDHDETTPAIGVAVVVWSDYHKFKFITITDNNGKFLIEVKPSTEFRLKASDGDQWHVYPKIFKGIPEGTIAK